jgi:hypothetical protein
MAKKENARLPKNEKTSAPDKREFTGTENLRQLRVLMALLTRPRSREAVDSIAGCSNGPDLIGKLRAKGLKIPCDETPVIDRDGQEVLCGVYYFTAEDRRKVRTWLIRRERALKKGGAK